MQRLRRMIARVAPADSTVMIRGETGSGKELVARALHHHSQRAAQPFLAVNCATMPDTLIEALLFGHERGAFTGAERRVRGQLELAGGGTLLFDEIAEMPLGAQGKLLRLLEEKQFRPLGSEAMVPFGARLIAATHADLEARVAAGSFRQDLYYRLTVVTLRVPSLAERSDDLPELLTALGGEHARKLRFSQEAIAWLAERRWPGNVRELRNVVERLRLLSDDDAITVDTLEELVEPRPSDVPAELDAIARSVVALPSGDESKLRMLEAAVVRRALEISGGNKAAAARLLGVERKVIERKVHRHARVVA
jgi:DNA-binding NtrC family response regulator